jgi:hypothetical protein
MPPAARCRLSTLSVDVGALAEQLFLGAAMIGVVFWHWRPLDPYLLHDARRKRLQSPGAKAQRLPQCSLNYEIVLTHNCTATTTTAS